MAVQVKFLQTWNPYVIGDVAELPADIATSLIADGICIRTATIPQWETR